MERIKSKLMDAAAMDRAMTRIAHEIIERNPDAEEIIIAGILRRGVPLARQIAENVQKFSQIKVHLSEVDISLYRDDLQEISEQPRLNQAVSFDVNHRRIVLVDDVLYTGRPVRAAIDALIAHGRPERIQLAVLVDRGHRELPIRGDYVGKNVPTSRQETVAVCMPEFDEGRKEVLILERQ